MSGEKTNKPWSFSLMGGKGGKMSVIAFICVVLIAIFTHIAGAVRFELKDRRERPSLALKSFLRDLREFIRTEKKFPADLRELEVKMWNKDAPDAPSRLNSPNTAVAGYYEYIYFTGMVNGQPQAHLWAIPLGKYRDEYNTVLLIVRVDGETTWSGPAVTDEQRRSIIKDGFNVPVERMSLLYMKMTQAESPPQKKKGFFK